MRRHRSSGRLKSILSHALLALLLSLLGVSSCCLGQSSSPLFGVSLLAESSKTGAFILDSLSTGYLLQEPTLSFSYTDMTSAATVAALEAESIDVGFISIPLTAAQAAMNPSFLQLPYAATAVVPVYNLPGLSPEVTLAFSARTLSLIFAGNITAWNDSAIAADNPNVTLPQSLPITAVLQAANFYTSYVLLHSLALMYPPLAALVPASNSPVWPLQRYASYLVLDSLQGASASVLVTPGSIGYCLWPIAAVNSNRIAALYSSDGQTLLQISSAAVQAAVSASATTRIQQYAAPQLTNDLQLDLAAAGGTGWPMVGAEYVLVDLAYSRTTCAARSALAEFLLWLYSGATAARILAANLIFPLPDVVVQQMQIVSRLSSQLMCRGQPAVVVATVNYLQVSGDSRLSVFSSLLAEEYNLAVNGQLTATDAFTLSFQSNPGSLAFDQMQFNEVAMSLFFTEDISPSLLQSVRASGAFSIVPLFLVTVVPITNQQISPLVSLGSAQLNLTFALLLSIWTAQLSSWRDPSVLSLNPALAQQFASLSPNATLDPAPIVVIFPCVIGSAGAYFSSVVSRFVQLPQLSVPAGTDFCSLTSEGPRLKFVQSEAVLTDAVQASTGAFSYAQRVGDIDDMTGVAALLLQTEEGGSLQYALPTSAAMLACMDAVNASTLQLDVAASSSPSCYPLTQVLYAMLPSSFSGSAACSAGNASYAFLLSLYNSSQHDAVYASQGIVRAAQDAELLQLSNAAVLQVSCDGQSLLAPQPVQWQLNSSISDFAFAMAVIGLSGIVCLLCLLLAYRRHRAVQASLPVLQCLMLLGCALLLVTVVVLQLPATSASCSFLLWGLNLSCSLMLCPLYAKVYRWHRSFSMRGKLKQVRLPLLYLCSLAPAVVDLPFVALWSAFAPYSPSVSLSQSTSPETSYLQCGFESTRATSAFLVTAVFCKGGLLLIGSVLAFSVRRMLVSYSENARVGYVLYNAVFAVGLLLPVMLLVEAKGDVQALLMTLLLLWLAFAPLLLLLSPLCWLLLVPSSASAAAALEPALSSARSVTLAFSFLAVDAMTEDMLAEYIQALERHVQEARMRKQDVDGPTGGGEPEPAQLVSNEQRHAGARQSQPRLVAEDEQGGASGGSSPVGSSTRSQAGADSVRRRAASGGEDGAPSPSSVTRGRTASPMQTMTLSSRALAAKAVR